MLVSSCRKGSEDLVAAAAGDPGSSLCPKPKLASICAKLMQAVKGRFCGREREPVLFSCVRFGVMSMTRMFFFGHMLIIWADYVDLFSHVLHYHFPSRFGVSAVAKNLWDSKCCKETAELLPFGEDKALQCASAAQVWAAHHTGNCQILTDEWMHNSIQRQFCAA